MKSTCILIWSLIGLIVVLLLLYLPNREFSLDLPIDDNAFASFGQILSGFATLITLLFLYAQIQFDKERAQADVMPLLIANPTTTKFIVVGIPTPRFEKPSEISIINMGQGHAKDITYTWHFNEDKLYQFLLDNGAEEQRPGQTFNPFVGIRKEYLKQGVKGYLPLIITGLESAISIQLPEYLNKYLEIYGPTGAMEALYEGDAESRLTGISITIDYRDIYNTTHSINIPIDYEYTFINTSLKLFQGPNA